MLLDDTSVRIPLRARDGSVRAYAIVDVADAEWVNQWRWHLLPNGYAVRNAWMRVRYRSIYLHRAILNLIFWTGLEGDHVNQDKLDNRRSNLRVVTIFQQRHNVPAHGGSSGHRGVTWDKKWNRWVAQLKLNGKHMHLGAFVSELEAAAVARDARLRLMTHTVEESA